MPGCLTTYFGLPVSDACGLFLRPLPGSARLLVCLHIVLCLVASCLWARKHVARRWQAACVEKGRSGATSKMDRCCRSGNASYTNSLSSSSARSRLSVCTGWPFFPAYVSVCFCLFLPVGIASSVSVGLFVCLPVCLPALSARHRGHLEWFLLE